MKKKAIGIKRKEHCLRVERHKSKRLKTWTPYKGNTNDKNKQCTLIAPIIFSLLENTNETLIFFDDFNKKTKEYNDITINMRTQTEQITIEVLLYIISLDRIYKSQSRRISIKIKVPEDEVMKHLIYNSGIRDYFQSNGKAIEDTESIFTIKDSNHKDSDNIARHASDFLSKFNKSKKRILFEAITEMKLNTENWAYGKKAKSTGSWYIFGIDNDSRIDFYFFDNGEGIATTLKRKLTDGITGKNNILKDALKGNNRSNTGLINRNKGLPQIRRLLTDEDVQFSTIITNKIKVDFNKETPNSEKYVKLEHNFPGTLFALAIKKEQKE